MEYKIFGAAGLPYEEFADELTTFCELDGLQREALARWFESTRDFDTDPSELHPVITTSSLLPEQFQKTANGIRFLLASWRRNFLEIADIERDLFLLGFAAEQIDGISTFLQRLAALKDRVWLDDLTANAQVVGLPTIDDVNILWDARPVFAGPNYYYFAGDAGPDHKECIALTYMAVLEIMMSDSNGIKDRIALQMNEDTFKALARAFSRAGDQLASLKKFLGALPGSRKGD